MHVRIKTEHRRKQSTHRYCSKAEYVRFHKRKIVGETGNINTKFRYRVPLIFLLIKITSLVS